MSVRLRRVPDPSTEMGRYYETQDGRFQVHQQENAEYFDAPDHDPGEPPFLWDLYRVQEDELYLMQTFERLREARAWLARIGVSP